MLMRVVAYPPTFKDLYSLSLESIYFQILFSSPSSYTSKDYPKSFPLTYTTS